MGRIIKALLFLAVVGVIGLAGYAYLGDMSAPVEPVSKPVDLDAY